jgi:hypothetical protein
MIVGRNTVSLNGWNILLFGMEDVVFSVRYDVNLNGPLSDCCTRPYSAVVSESLFRNRVLCGMYPYIRPSLEPASS